MRVAIIGAGISGLATAYYLRQAKPDWEIRLFEKDDQVGGKVRSSQEKGFVFDWGPNGFLTNVDDTLDLAKNLGLADQLQVASDHARHRLLYKQGRLFDLPASPPKLLKTGLLNPYAKFRALAELSLGKASYTEESVYDFMARHFGKGVAETFAGPAVLGITAGDAKELSLDALFPRFRKLEHEHGSLIRAMMAAQQQAKASSRSSRLTSFNATGVQALSTALRDALLPCIRTAQELKLVSLEQGEYWLEFADGSVYTADKLILATPTFVMARLLTDLAPVAAAELGSIPYADVVVIGLGYDRIDVPQPLDAFGFLVARGEAVRSLGVLYSSSIFPDQAESDKVMLRVICGGSLDPEFIGLSDIEMLEVVRHDLSIAMGITAKPEFQQIVRWPRGIPQYTLGHGKKVAQIMHEIKSLSGLHLVGNAFYGVGVNDAVRDARRVVAELTA